MVQFSIIGIKSAEFGARKPDAERLFGPTEGSAPTETSPKGRINPGPMTG